MFFPWECTATRCPEVLLDFILRLPMAGQLLCRNTIQAMWRTGLEEKGDLLHEAVGAYADRTIINSLACVSTPLRGVQHKRTENNCLVWGMYHAHDGSVKWNHGALWTGRLSARCSEECERSILGLDGKGYEFVSSGDTVPDSGLLKSSVCSLVAAIVFHRFHSCKAPTRVIKSSSLANGPYDPEIKSRLPAVCPPVAYLKADRTGELSVRIYKLLFGLKILHWLECCFWNSHSFFVPCIHAKTVIQSCERHTRLI